MGEKREFCESHESGGSNPIRAIRLIRGWETAIPMTEISYKEESYRIIGACFEVYNEMGCGFLEPVYQECLQCELQDQGLPVVAKRVLKLEYKQHQLESTYVPDFVCFDSIILELKAVKQFCNEHRAQVHNYLKATGCRLGLLVNFGHHPQLEYERIVR